MNPDERSAEKELEESFTRVEGRYKEAIPWKYDGPVLPDNYKMALRRFLDIEKRLMKNSEMGEGFTARPSTSAK